MSYYGNYKWLIQKDLVSEMKNIQDLPTLKKVVIHMSLKEGKTGMTPVKKLLLAYYGLEIITGNKGQPHFSKQNLVKLNVSKGSLQGISMTLRNKEMEAFLTNFMINVSPLITKNKELQSKKYKAIPFTYTITLRNILELPMIISNGSVAKVFVPNKGYTLDENYLMPIDLNFVFSTGPNKKEYNAASRMILESILFNLLNN